MICMEIPIKQRDKIFRNIRVLCIITVISFFIISGEKVIHC